MKTKNNLCEYDYARAEQGAVETGPAPAASPLASTAGPRAVWNEAYALGGANGLDKGMHIAEVGLQIRVIVADDHPVVLEGVRTVLERSRDADIKVVAEARNGDELIDLLTRCPCDVIITDFTMPGGRYGDGLPLLTLLASRYPDIPVIVQTMVNNVGVLRTAMKQGVLGLADKPRRWQSWRRLCVRWQPRRASSALRCANASKNLSAPIRQSAVPRLRRRKWRCSVSTSAA